MKSIFLSVALSITGLFAFSSPVYAARLTAEHQEYQVTPAAFFLNAIEVSLDIYEYRSKQLDEIDVRFIDETLQSYYSAGRWSPSFRVLPEGEITDRMADLLNEYLQFHYLRVRDIGLVTLLTYRLNNARLAGNPFLESYYQHSLNSLYWNNRRSDGRFGSLLAELTFNLWTRNFNGMMTITPFNGSPEDKLVVFQDLGSTEAEINYVNSIPRDLNPVSGNDSVLRYFKGVVYRQSLNDNIRKTSEKSSHLSLLILGVIIMISYLTQKHYERFRAI